MSHLVAELIGELFKWLIEAIWERYPTTSKVIYSSTFILCFVYFWLFDEMKWWGAMIFAVFLSLIFATLLIVLLHLGVKWFYRGSNGSD